MIAELQFENTQGMNRAQSHPSVSDSSLEHWVGLSLLDEVEGQLGDIQNDLQSQIQEKKALREEMATLYRLDLDTPAVEAEGEKYRKLSSDQANLLGVRDQATPVTDAAGNIDYFQIDEETFQSAKKAGLELREENLAEMNSMNERTMLKIQNLVDQRKNLLTLMSNLLASSNEVAKNIIGNIRS